MDYINDLDKCAIVLIYPDGLIEKKAINSNMDFHMEYMVYLINHSPRLKEIVERNNYEVPKNPIDIKYSMTYELDQILAQNGIISFHNFRVGLDNFDMLDDPVVAEAMEREYNIILPNNLTYKQKELLKAIIIDYDLSNGYYGTTENNMLVDISFEEAQEIIGKESEKTI